MASRRTVHDLLEAARARYIRLTPEQAYAASRRGALLIDTRDGEQRRRYGTVPGALAIDRTVLEWRVDPSSGATHPSIRTLATPLVLFCQQGYSSSLAVASLLDLGASDVSDIIGGFEAWRSAGLPIHPPRRRTFGTAMSSTSPSRRAPATQRARTWTVTSAPPGSPGA